MKKVIFILMLVAPFAAAIAQEAGEKSVTYGKMTTGLSIALIISFGLLMYTLIQKGKLHKENKELHKRIQELEQ